MLISDPFAIILLVTTILEPVIYLFFTNVVIRKNTAKIAGNLLNQLQSDTKLAGIAQELTKTVVLPVIHQVITDPKLQEEVMTPLIQDLGDLLADPETLEPIAAYIQKVITDPTILDPILERLTDGLLKKFGVTPSQVSEAAKSGKPLRITGNSFIDGLITQFAPVLMAKYLPQVLPEAAAEAVTTVLG